MKTKCLAFIIAVIFHNFHNTSLAAPGGAVRLAGLTPVSEMYLGQEVLSLDKHKSTNTVLLAGKAFRDGIGVEAGSALVYALKGGYKRLEIKAGIGPEGKGFYSDRTVRFAVYGDGRLLYRGGGRRWGDEPESINVPLEGVQRLELATRGRLEAESDPRAAFWAEGQLYTADKPAGGVAAAALRAESAAGSDMRLSAFGEDGLLPEEYRFLREFVEETGYQLGTDLLIIRNGAAAALDIAPAIINAGGFFTVSPHLYSWNHEYFPIRHRTYAVHKMLHGISRKKPEVVRFNKTEADPVLTKADRKKLEGFLNSIGAWNRGDLLLIEKEGIEVSLKSGPEESNLGMMKTFEPENYKIYQAAPGLNLLEEFKSLAGDRAAVAAGVEKCEGKVYKPCTTYVIQIPRSRAEKMPLGVKIRLYLLRGLIRAEPLAAIALGVLIFRRRRRLFKYYALFSAIPLAAFLVYRIVSEKGEVLRSFMGSFVAHAPLLAIFLLFFLFMRAEYVPFRRVWARRAAAGLKWLSLSAAGLMLLAIGSGITYSIFRTPEVVETARAGEVAIKYVRTRPLIRALEKIPGFEDNLIGWAGKKDNNVTCYVSLSKIEETYAGIEKEWPGIYHRKDFRSRIVWNMLKGVPAGRRREYFTDLEKRSALAHEMSHAEDLLRSPYADGHDYINTGWTEGETKARLAGLRVSPFSLAALCLRSKKYERIREKIFGGFTAYEDTPGDEDIALLPAAELTRRAEEIYQRIIAGAGFDYWIGKAQAAASPPEKLRYYKWALEKWDWSKDGKAEGLTRKAEALKELAFLRWEKGDFSEAARGFADMARTDAAGCCAALQDNAAAQAYVRSPAAPPVARKAYFEAFTVCGNYYIHSDTVSEKGFAYFKTAAEFMPDSPFVYQAWSKAWLSRGRHGKARSVLDLGIKNNPASAMMYLIRGSARLEEGDRRKALEDLRKASELDPGNEGARLLLARTCYDSGRGPEALDVLKGDAKKLAAAYRSSADRRYAAKEYAKAVSEYSKAIDLEPNYAETYYWRGAAYNELGRYKEALADLNKAKALNLKDGGLYISFGFNYAKRRLYNKAAEAFSKAIELDKGSFWSYNNRAWVSLIQGRCGPARADLEKARPLADGRHNLYSNLATYYWSCRRDKEKTIANYAAAFSRGYEHKVLPAKSDTERLMQGLYDTPEFKALLDKHSRKTGDAGVIAPNSTNRPLRNL